jgi:hypothetical protein
MCEKQGKNGSTGSETKCRKTVDIKGFGGISRDERIRSRGRS